jgi:NADPH:quinone reductase-like Zn-dependent oxidoreductase
VLPLIADGRIRPVVDRAFPLERVSEAHEYMESNANFGKIMLTTD